MTQTQIRALRGAVDQLRMPDGGIANVMTNPFNRPGTVDKQVTVTYLQGRRLHAMQAHHNNTLGWSLIERKAA